MPDPTQKQNVDVCSHPEAWDTFQALAGRAMDGGALLEYLLADPVASRLRRRCRNQPG